MGDLLVALGDDFVLRQAGAAARAPGHRVGAAVQPAVFVAALEEVPDGVVILIRHGVVGVIPVHPVAEAAGLLGLDGGVLAHPLLALLHEAGDAEGLDVMFGGKALFLFHLHLDPQPLAVESVLVALAVALHGAPAQEQVLVGAPPGVVHPHRVVGGNRTVNKGVAPLGAGVALQVALDDAGVAPPAELFVLQRDKVHARRYRGKHTLNLSPARLPGQDARPPAAADLPAADPPFPDQVTARRRSARPACSARPGPPLTALGDGARGLRLICQGAARKVSCGAYGW